MRSSNRPVAIAEAQRERQGRAAMRVPVVLALLTFAASVTATPQPSLRVRRSRRSALLTPPSSEELSTSVVAAAVPASEQQVRSRGQEDAILAASNARREARQLLIGRCFTTICLFLFAVLNGVARRSLSSSGPSLVAEGVLTVERLEDIFKVGFNAFALGKFLAVPLMFVGSKRAMLLQIFMISGACTAFCIAPREPLVQSGCWAVLRVFSAMALSTALPFVGNWFPRKWYGRIWAFVNAGFQVGYLVASYGFQALLFSNRGLHWRVPMLSCAVGGVVLFVMCAVFLQPAPSMTRQGSPLPAVEKESDRAQTAEASESQPRPIRARLLLRKMWSRWVFWAMIIACAAYTPLVEYGTHVTSYLKEMRAFEPGSSRPGQDGFVCLASTTCESRYRSYVFSYLSALLLGSVVYDRATQLDKALLVAGLFAVNVACWTGLALSEPATPPPRAATPAPSASFGGQLGSAQIWSIMKSFSQRAAEGAYRFPRRGFEPPKPSNDGLLLPLSTGTKTVLASVAGATIALPVSLPFAMFALDFGKEGAALLSSVLSAVGCASSLIFLRLFPEIVRKYGWCGVHTSLASLGGVSALSMSTIMFSDQRKFSRGYIIRSSLTNATVVTMHACGRPSCAAKPMWRPGARRLWDKGSGAHPVWRAHAPNSRCHHCGRRELLECKVDEGAAELALITPFKQCSRWVLEQAPLRKPKGGWAFADPLRYPLANDTTYGDRRAYERRLMHVEQGDPLDEPADENLADAETKEQPKDA